MIVRLFPFLIFLAAIGSGLMAGLFFTFSNSVMPALARMPGPQGITAMNHVNTVIQNPLFFASFFGTALISLFLLVGALLGWTPARGWVAAGALFYLVGCIVITVGVNVPMNNALAAVSTVTKEGADLWATYLDRWVYWNNIRAIACTAALMAFIVAQM